MNLDFLALASVIQVILFSLGVTYVITGSVIGYTVRFVWCACFYWWRPLHSLWYVVQCPSCNAWWTGAATALLFDLSFMNAIQMAFTACGVVAVLQFALGGNGIAADEDMEQTLKEVFNGK